MIPMRNLLTTMFSELMTSMKMKMAKWLSRRKKEYRREVAEAIEAVQVLLVKTMQDPAEEVAPRKLQEEPKNSLKL